MFCPKCGAKNETDAVYCANCGLKLPDYQTEQQDDTSVSVQNDIEPQPIVTLPPKVEPLLIS